MTAGPGRAALDLDKLYAARLHAVRVRPYLATALFALHVVESSRVPTMAVDRHWRCYASPAFVEQTSVEELAGVWVHEVSHLLRDHHGRSDRQSKRQDNFVYIKYYGNRWKQSSTDFPYCSCKQCLLCCRSID